MNGAENTGWLASPEETVIWPRISPLGQTPKRFPEVGTGTEQAVSVILALSPPTDMFIVVDATRNLELDRNILIRLQIGIEIYAGLGTASGVGYASDVEQTRSATGRCNNLEIIKRQTTAVD